MLYTFIHQCTHPLKYRFYCSITIQCSESDSDFSYVPIVELGKDTFCHPKCD